MGFFAYYIVYGTLLPAACIVIANLVVDLDTGLVYNMVAVYSLLLWLRIIYRGLDPNDDWNQ